MPAHYILLTEQHWSQYFDRNVERSFHDVEEQAPMDYVEFGKTGLKVSVAGLGGGGASQLGAGYKHKDAPVEKAVDLVRTALDLGINYIDTAPDYQTEGVVGQAVRGRRDEVIISTKINPIIKGASGSEATRMDAATLRSRIHESLRRLETDHLDVFLFKSLKWENYAYCKEELLPELERLRQEGTIRFIGLSETFPNDKNHLLLHRAAKYDDIWDVLLVGFNLLNPSARSRVLSRAIEKRIGIAVMYAVRDLLSHPDLLRKAIAGAIADGVIDPSAIDAEDPLGFLVHDGGASSVIEAAYRFARHEPGCHVVLTGTGNVEHLKSNLAAINMGPLPQQDRDRLASIFGHLTYFTGDRNGSGLPPS